MCSRSPRDYDLAFMFCVAESITRRWWVCKRAFRRFSASAERLVAAVVISNGSGYYPAGEGKFPNVDLTAEDIPKMIPGVLHVVPGTEELRDGVTLTVVTRGCAAG